MQSAFKKYYGFGFVIATFWLIVPAAVTQTRPQPISFLNEVEPILTHSGCNSGPCHGSQFGKGGFKLSLAGYDPEFDYDSIVKLSSGRRISFPAPVKSLLLKKPSLQIPHNGGLKLALGSEDYATIAAWISQGAPPANLRDPSVSSLTVLPPRAKMKRGDHSNIRVLANMSDGRQLEVTRHTRINSLNEAIATSTSGGLVTAQGIGATAIMLRYGGQAAISRVVVPYSNHYFANNTPIVSRVDRLVSAGWNELGLIPSSRCTDGEFIRRASLDIAATLPEPEDVKAFLQDGKPSKRQVLIDRLLDSPAYADYWAVKWADLLRVSKTTLGAKAQSAMNGWLRQNFAANRPMDEMVRDLLTGTGNTASNAPANFFRTATGTQELTEISSQLFLGVRLQCARCHHHPFEKWSQADYYQFGAFFARVGHRPSAEIATTQFVMLRPTGEVTHPKSGAVMAPIPPAFSDAPAFRPSNDPDRRDALASWLTDRRNLPFARNIVNRYWGALMGRGLVEPVDDVRVTNPPSNPELLDWLAKDFVANGFDLKHLIRTICNSQAYQLSSNSTSANRMDRVFYSHFVPRRQPAEVLLDSICRATGISEKFEGIPAGTRAIELPDSTVASAFLDSFGRPPRATSCECERTGEPNLIQSLQLLNGDVVNAKVSAANGRAAKLATQIGTDGAILDELYLSTLSRFPTSKERQTGLTALARSPNRRQATEDIMWALLNSTEFVFVR